MSIKLCCDCNQPMTDEDIFYLEYRCSECEAKAHEEFKKSMELERTTGED